MGVVAWLIFGLIAGAIAQLLVPGEDPGSGGLLGIVMTIVIGIAGALIGGWVGTQLGWGSVTSFDIRSLGLAILGAVLLLVGLRAIRGGSRSLAEPPGPGSSRRPPCARGGLHFAHGPGICPPTPPFAHIQLQRPMGLGTRMRFGTRSMPLADANPLPLATPRQRPTRACVPRTASLSRPAPRCSGDTLAGVS